MQLFLPEILEEAHGLSIGLSLTGCVVGLLLWLTGWLGHRFWIVLVMTLLGGVVGLVLGPLYDMKPPVLAGILAALAAGVLALALVRVIVFAAGGAAACVAAHVLVPPAWQAPLGWFLAGGLVGLLLFRLWTMVLTSFTGTLLMGYSSLCLLDRLGRLDAVAFTETRAFLLNGIGFGLTLLGVIVQFLLERRRLRNEQWHAEQMQQISEKEQEILYGRRRWFNWGGPYRRAG